MEVGRSAYRGESDALVVPYVNRLAIWNPLTERIIRSWTLEDKNIEDLAVTNDGKYALVTLCIGVGQGYATILENPNAA